MDRIRREIVACYDQSLQSVPGIHGAGMRPVRQMLSGAHHAAASASPTWLTVESVAELRAGVRAPASAADLVAAGTEGLLFFQEPVTQTTLGDAGPRGVAPINALVWWTGGFDGHDILPGAAERDLVVVHALSSYASALVPWSPAVWSDSMVTDIGMFPLALHGEIAPPPERFDDLAPVIEVLLGLGAAVRESRVLFGAVGEDAEPGAPRARTVDVLA